MARTEPLWFVAVSDLEDALHGWPWSIGSPTEAEVAYLRRRWAEDPELRRQGLRLLAVFAAEALREAREIEFLAALRDEFDAREIDG